MHCEETHGWVNVPRQKRLVDSAASVRLATRINMVFVKKRHVGNYPEKEGQRDGSAFATTWTLMLSKSENGIYFPPRKRLLSLFVPESLSMSLLCHLTRSYTLLLWPYFFKENLFFPVNGKPFVQSFIEVFKYEGQ